jgi:hypothetical protein
MPSPDLEKRRAQQNARRQADPERFAAYEREWRSKNAEKVAEHNRRARGKRAAVQSEAADIAQDIRAMRSANPTGTLDVARAMVALGRWTPEAQQAFAEAVVRHGFSDDVYGFIQH